MVVTVPVGTNAPDMSGPRPGWFEVVSPFVDSKTMPAPLRLDEPEARRRFDAARSLIVNSATLASMHDTLRRIDESLQAASAARARLLQSVAQLDPAAIDRELKQALRAYGRQAPEVAAIQRRRQVVIGYQDEIDAVDEHVYRTVLDVEALAAKSAGGGASSPSAIGRQMQDDLDLLRADTAALESARRELEAY